MGARVLSRELEWGWLTLHADGSGSTAVELDHALNARESHQVPITEVVGIFSQSKNARGPLDKRWLGSESPVPAFHRLRQPILCPHPSAHLGDVLDGGCQGLFLCKVLNSEVLTKVTE